MPCIIYSVIVGLDVVVMSRSLYFQLLNSKQFAQTNRFRIWRRNWRRREKEMKN